MATKSTQTEQVRSPRREAIGVILLALCLLSFLSVFSFNADDIGLLNSPAADPPHNLVGPFGAGFAFVGFFLFGVVGYFMPLVLLIGGLMMTLRSYERIWPKWMWLLCGVTSVASLMEYQAVLMAGRVEGLNLVSPGGLVGQMLGTRTLGHWIGHTGATVIFLTALFLSVLQLTGMHPFTPILYVINFFKGLFNGEKSQARVKPERSKKAPKPKAEKPVRAPRVKKQKAVKPPKEPKALKKAPREPKAPSEELFTPPTPTKAATTPVRAPAPAPRKAPMPMPIPVPVPVPVAPKPRPAAPAPEVAPELISQSSVNVSHSENESDYQIPSLDLLDELPTDGSMDSQEDTAEKSRVLQETLEQFGVDGHVSHVETGPTVTSYEVTPAPGVRVNKITALERDIARSMRAQSIRIQAPIPGKDAVGIEIPNEKSSPVFLRQLAESDAFRNPDIALPLALGTDVSGKMVIGDLASMPHMLIAGATGAGKTVCMNSLLTGLLLSRSPDEMRMILVDPKTFEFQSYENLKHLVVPIITDAKKVTLGLRWAIKEMEKRYSLFKKEKVRDIKSYNNRPISEDADGSIPAKLPYIVIVVDELAELMGVAQQEIEPCIVRLAQLSRAAGIHMILATQRPSVNVITGTIKANIPGRIAFQVAQGNDSRTILDSIGAEKLLGKGDMLYLPPGKAKPIRLQGAWTKDDEMNRVTDFVRAQGEPDFIVEITQKIESDKPAMPEKEEDNELYEQAMEVLRTTKRASTSSLQRRLRIGYNRAANLMDLLEEKGIIGPPTETGPRDILVDLDGEIPDAPTIDAAQEAQPEGVEDPYLDTEEAQAFPPDDEY